MQCRKNDFFLYLIVVFFIGLLLVRCYYSFCWSDESYYLAMVHRLWIGERMVVDEWNRAQFYVPLLLPIYSLYMFLHGNNDGVYLFFRMIAVLWTGGISLYCYYALRKKHTASASLICALTFLLFSRGNISGVSYYCVVLNAFMWALLIIYRTDFSSRTHLRMIIAGILLAISVLGNPFLTIPYILAIIFLLVFKKFKNYHMSVIYVLTGIIMSAAVYLGYLFSTITLNQLLKFLPHILNEPEMESVNPLISMAKFVLRIPYRYKYTIAITVICIAVSIIYKKRHPQKTVSVSFIKVMILLNFAIFLINTALSFDMLGCVNFALIIFAIQCYLFIPNVCEETNKILWLFVLPGLLLSFAFELSSNTGLTALTIGGTIVGIAAVLVIENFYLEYAAYPWLKISLGLILIIATLQSLFLRVFSVYRDAPIQQLDYEISSGPARYLRTTENSGRQYDMLCLAIDELMADGENHTILFSRICNWAYLCSNSNYGTPYPWRVSVNSPRLQEYYAACPDKIPDIIFILNSDCGAYQSFLTEGNEIDTCPNQDEKTGFLLDYIKEHSYPEQKYDFGTVYKRGR